MLLRVLLILPLISHVFIVILTHFSCLLIIYSALSLVYSLRDYSTNSHNDGYGYDTHYKRLSERCNVLEIYTSRYVLLHDHYYYYYYHHHHQYCIVSITIIMTSIIMIVIIVIIIIMIIIIIIIIIYHPLLSL